MDQWAYNDALCNDCAPAVPAAPRWLRDAYRQAGRNIFALPDTFRDADEGAGGAHRGSSCNGDPAKG